jgi:hypothetical protein
VWAAVNCGRKEELIPAYHDEQDWDELRTDGRWAAQSLRVAVVPQPDNNMFASSDYTTRRHVGDLYLSGNLPTTHILYRKGVRLGKNKVELEIATDQAGNRFWQYIITPASSSGVTLEPFRVPGGPHRHFDAAIPPTMRFRYTMLDSGIWGPCGQACCPTDGM